jgi:hypothetical protein
MTRVFVPLSLALLAAACSSSSHTPDGGTPDGGAPTLVTASGTYSKTLTIKTGPKAGTCAFSLTVAGTEDKSTPWLCPTCTTIFRTPATFTAGSDCVMNLISAVPSTFWFGITADGHTYSGFDFAFAASDSPEGTFTQTAGQLTATLSLDSAQATISGSAQLTLGSAGGDPLGGWTPAASYSCGWPRTNPPAYQGNYEAIVGDKLPDGVFIDQCGDKVRLHDLLGRYLVLHANQTDRSGSCGPCNMAGDGQAQFEADMKALAIPTLVVTFAVPNYTTSRLSPSQTEVKSWVDATKTSGIALADRGFGSGVVILGGAIGDPTKVGYPGFSLAAPDGTILWATVGVDTSATANNTWTILKTQIMANAGK